MRRANAVRLCIGVALAAPALSFAHGGGLNADGCHNDKKSGGYHCHRAPAVANSLPAVSNVAPQLTTPARPNCYTGPRGGTYTLTAGGKKNYGGC